jgi:hypothetical protein
VTDHDTFQGIDVNEFTTRTIYGIFNDPEVFEPRFASGELNSSLRAPLIETPLYEDESLKRTMDHARLMTDDRRLNGNDDPVVIKKMVELRSPWGPIDDTPA